MFTWGCWIILQHAPENRELLGQKILAWELKRCLLFLVVPFGLLMDRKDSGACLLPTCLFLERGRVLANNVSSMTLAWGWGQDLRDQTHLSNKFWVLKPRIPETSLEVPLKQCVMCLTHSFPLCPTSFTVQKLSLGSCWFWACMYIILPPYHQYSTKLFLHKIPCPLWPWTVIHLYGIISYNLEWTPGLIRIWSNSSVCGNSYLPSLHDKPLLPYHQQVITLLIGLSVVLLNEMIFPN